MMQALEHGLGSLSLAIRNLLSRMGLRRESHVPASRRLARDLGLPADEIQNILGHAVEEVRQLDDADGDPWPIINRAMDEIAKLGSRANPAEEAAVTGYLHELPERDRQILHHFNDGRKHGETARQVGADEESVCDSLATTYTGLRFTMHQSDGHESDGDDGGLPSATERSPRPLDAKAGDAKASDVRMAKPPLRNLMKPTGWGILTRH